MPFVPTPTTQINMRYLWDNQQCENILHYSTLSPPTLSIDLADIDAVGTAIVDAWILHQQGVTPTTLSFVELLFTDLTVIDGYSVNFNLGLPLAGTNANQSLPNNCALVVTKRTAKRGRAFRGRSYVPGLQEGGVNGNSVTSAIQTAALNFFNDIRIIAVGAPGYQMQVAHRFSGTQPLENGTVEPVTNFTTNATVDSQRRRLPGRGE